MLNKALATMVLGSALTAGQALAQTAQVGSKAVTCADLKWAASVLASNPDIAQSCQSVYEKDGHLYAKTTVEVVRVRGNTLTFRPLHADGSLGDSRTVTVDGNWRATIAGRQYRASDLSRGQQLNVYVPEDRFALAVEDEDGPDRGDLVDIQNAP